MNPISSNSLIYIPSLIPTSIKTNDICYYRIISYCTEINNIQMVDATCKIPDTVTDSRCQRSEFRDQSSEVRGQRSEVRGGIFPLVDVFLLLSQEWTIIEMWRFFEEIWIRPHLMLIVEVFPNSS